LSIQSVILPCGFVLSQTSGIPLADVSCLVDLLSVSSTIGGENTEFPMKRHNYRSVIDSKQAYADWFWHFGVHFGSLAAVQLAFALDCPNPLSIVIDEKNANLQFCSLDASKGHPEFQFPRICGKLRRYVDGRVMAESIQRGMMTAGNCLEAWKVRFALQHRNVFGYEFEGIERLGKLSVLKRDVDEVCKEIQELLKAAGECQSLFIVPWI
jgi:hypothetical protein